MKLRLNESNIIWPGRLTKKPEGFMIPTHLKVLTIEEKPFVYVRSLKKDDGNSCKSDEIICPLYNTSSKGIIFYIKKHTQTYEYLHSVVYFRLFSWGGVQGLTML